MARERQPNTDLSATSIRQLPRQLCFVSQVSLHCHVLREQLQGGLPLCLGLGGESHSCGLTVAGELAKHT